MTLPPSTVLSLLTLPALAACGGEGAPIGVAVEGACETAGLTEGPDGGLMNSGTSNVPLTSDGKVDYLRRIGRTKDFEVLASEPIDATLPGARSGKVIYDTAQNDGGVYFQNSVANMIHYDFASPHPSGSGLPVVPQRGNCNSTEGPDVRE